MWSLQTTQIHRYTYHYIYHAVPHECVHYYMLSKQQKNQERIIYKAMIDNAVKSNILILNWTEIIKSL